MFRRQLAQLAVALALVLLPASALAAVATANVNVRAGPGTLFPVIGTLRAGESVDVGPCVPTGWCQIQRAGPNGWVSATYLDTRPSRPGPGPGFGQRPPSGPGFGQRPGGPGFGVSRVCFYEHQNYQGRSFCANSREARSALSGFWNDRISSIRVQGRASVQVCEHVNFRGRCDTIRRDTPFVGNRWNDTISSYRVF